MAKSEIDVTGKGKKCNALVRTPPKKEGSPHGLAKCGKPATRQYGEYYMRCDEHRIIGWAS